MAEVAIYDLIPVAGFALGLEMDDRLFRLVTGCTVAKLSGAENENLACCGGGYRGCSVGFVSSPLAG